MQDVKIETGMLFKMAITCFFPSIRSGPVTFHSSFTFSVNKFLLLYCFLPNPHSELISILKTTEIKNNLHMISVFLQEHN